ncbi:hypothetical protein [Rhizobium sp. CCGE531]|nr:hypothetical protein [Rhizobium sp. CCGE531]
MELYLALYIDDPGEGGQRSKGIAEFGRRWIRQFCGGKKNAATKRAA